MSIEKVGNTDSSYNVGSRLGEYTLAGAIAGGLYTASSPRWLQNGAPADVFIKSVSQSMQNDLPQSEYAETIKIDKFLKAVVNPNTKPNDLKPLILDSKELSEAIKQNDAETVDAAIGRVFSQKDDAKIKQDLLELQYRTKSDKKVNRHAARNLILSNFDPKTKKLVKAEETSEEMFGMLKKTAAKIHSTAVAKGAAVGAILAGTLGLFMTKVPGEN